MKLHFRSPAAPTPLAQVPEHGGLSLEIRKALLLSRQYEDYGDGGESAYVEATARWAELLQGGGIPPPASGCPHKSQAAAVAPGGEVYW